MRRLSFINTLLAFLVLALPATDNFNRADLDDLGANWTEQRGLWGISGNAAHRDVNSPDTDVFVFWNADSFGNDQLSEVVISAGLAASVYAGVSVRASGTGAARDAYYYLCDTGSGIVRKMVDGLDTDLATGLNACANGDELRLEVTGTTIKAYKNDVQQGSNITDSALTSGSAGLFIYENGTSLKLDDWRGDNLGAGPTLPPVFINVPLIIRRFNYEAA